MKIISWNVNGIRAVLKKGFLDYIKSEDPDIICLQEIKAMESQVEFELHGYTQYWNSAEKKGYSGTAIFSKTPALNCIKGIDSKVSFKDKYGDASTEGRVLALEFEKFYIVTVYTPNSKGDLSRLDFREKVWDIQFLKYIKELESTKPVVFCGDLNVAHQEIDLARPDDNHHAHGFTDNEREGFNNIVKEGFVDTFRMFCNEGGKYTWWSPFRGARERNIGWRIDYVCVSDSIKQNVKEAFIRSDVYGSDHCPVGVVLYTH